MAKKAKTSKKGNSTAQGAKLNAAATVPMRNLAAAKKEIGFQTGIERFQLILKKGDFALSKLVEKANEELERLAKRQRELKAANLIPMSDYSRLKEIYETDLAHMTLDAFADSAMIDAKRFLSKAQGKVSKEQERIVIDYYKGVANRNFSVVSKVYGILVLKGQIKPTPKQVDKPTIEPELAPISEGVEKKVA